MNFSHKIQGHTQPGFDIPIVQKLYELYTLLHQYLKLFPKSDRYTLGHQIQNRLLVLLSLVITAGTSQKDKKLAFLNKAVVSLDLLKILIRLAKDTQAMDNHKYLNVEQALQEIGRMLGGWRRSLQSIFP